jgi:UDP-N-acetylmuramate--alanine ligase
MDGARAGDVVLCMGAGSIGAVPQQVVDSLLKKEQTMDVDVDVEVVQ